MSRRPESFAANQRLQRLGLHAVTQHTSAIWIQLSCLVTNRMVANQMERRVVENSSPANLCVSCGSGVEMPLATASTLGWGLEFGA
jgi:hypothetical protein